MVVERQQMHPALGDIGQRHVQRIEVVGLPPQVRPHVAGPASPIQRVEDGAPHRRPAQSGLPRQGDAVKRGGDAIGQQLPLGLLQCSGHRKLHAGTRLQLAFERIAMKIDDTRHHQQPARVKCPEARAAGPDFADDTVLDEHFGLMQRTIQQHAPAFDQHVGQLRSVGSNTSWTRGVG